MNPALLGEQRYRCPCGREVDVNATQDQACPYCGRRIVIASFDPTQTLSFFASNGSDISPLTPGNRLLADDRTGQQLGYFRLEKKLGEGGMGAVYRALDESLQRYVAVKVMRATSGPGSSAQRVSRLLDEAVAQARVSHPNIVTIYYVGRDEEEPFFAMELLPGPTVEEELRKGPLPYSQVIRLTCQVVDALAQASRMGLVHGDIKPSNLLFAGAELLKLSDFGLAKTPEMASNRGISGTLSYLSPELADGESPSEKSDMYALGVTLFEMTFGRRPYYLSGETLTDQLQEHRTARIEFPEKWPKEIPLGWRGVLERLLAKESRDRYASYAELQADLRKLMPVGVTHAGFLVRTLAFMVDMTVIGMLMLPLMLPLFLYMGLSSASLEGEESSFVSSMTRSLRVVSLIGLFTPAVPVLFCWLEWKGYQSPGRYLFQLRVVDSHGLPLDPQRRLLRSIIRYAMFWIGSLQSVIFTLGAVRLGWGIGMADELALLINILPILGPQHLVLHDRVCNSHVALDTQRSKSR